MRPGQNKRMRGRNNRRGPNPLTRSYESNGPDVKIRGTAAHIAEKYVSLARDAHASGDPVAAESYLQHAEHYLRLIAAAQQQQFQAQQPPTGGRVEDLDDGLDSDDEFESSVMDRFTFRAPQAPGAPVDPNGDQPRLDYPPRNDQPRQDRPDRQDRPERQERPDRQDQPREMRNNGEFRRDRNNGEFRRDRNFDRGQPRFERPQPDVVEGDTALPSFITAPVRIPIETAATGATGEQPDMGEAPVLAGDEEGGRFPLRPRRRRHRRGPRDDMQGGEDSAGMDAPAPQDAPTE